MTRLLSITSLALFCAASASIASATPLSGSVGVSAPVVAAFTPDGPDPTTYIDFTPAVYSVGPGAGDYTGSSVSLTTTPFTFSLGTTMSPELLLTVTAGGTSDFTGSGQFMVTEVTLNANTGTYDFYGTLNPNAGASFTTTSADFALSPLDVTPGGGTPITVDGEYSARLFSPSVVAATPEPSSLILLGTGLVSAGGMMLRRRRNA